MKGYRFYEECESKGKKDERPLGRCIAVALDIEPWYVGGYDWTDPADGEVKRVPITWLRHAATSLYDEPNSVCLWGTISLDYIQRHCKRVSESRAREVHPRLFERLEGA